MGVNPICLIYIRFVYFQRPLSKSNVHNRHNFTNSLCVSITETLDRLLILQNCVSSFLTYLSNQTTTTILIVKWSRPVVSHKNNKITQVSIPKFTQPQHQVPQVVVLRPSHFANKMASPSVSLLSFNFSIWITCRVAIPDVRTRAFICSLRISTMPSYAYISLQPGDNEVPSSFKRILRAFTSHISAMIPRKLPRSAMNMIRAHLKLYGQTGNKSCLEAIAMIIDECKEYETLTEGMTNYQAKREAGRPKWRNDIEDMELYGMLCDGFCSLSP